MKTVVITQPEFNKARLLFESAALRCLAAPPAEDALAEAIRQAGAGHAIVGIQAYRGPLYDALPRGGVLARFGVGHDGIDKARATAAGILCTNTPGVLDESVAELTLSMLLDAARHTSRLASAMAGGKWSPVVGGELRGRTLVVIGCGSIGCLVARIASTGFGMRVVGVTRNSRARNEAPFERLTSDLEGALAGADYVSLHIPATASNAQFVDARLLSMVPPHAWIVNTARGAVVSESDLYDALAAGRIAGAALDVFAVEPYEPADAGRDLRTLPNVILTPHVGSNTTEANHRMAEAALDNVALGIEGAYGRMNLLNPEVLSSR